MLRSKPRCKRRSKCVALGGPPFSILHLRPDRPSKKAHQHPKAKLCKEPPLLGVRTVGPLYAPISQGMQQPRVGPDCAPITRAGPSHPPSTPPQPPRAATRPFRSFPPRVGARRAGGGAGSPPRTHPRRKACSDNDTARPASVRRSFRRHPSAGRRRACPRTAFGLLWNCSAG
jgi:hypothetical protein